MKKSTIIVLVSILILSLASVGFASEENGHGPKGIGEQVTERVQEMVRNEEPVGQTISRWVRDQIGVTGVSEEDPLSEDEESAGGMPFKHGVTGAEFGQMVRTLAFSGPGAVARHILSKLFAIPTME